MCQRIQELLHERTNKTMGSRRAIEINFSHFSKSNFRMTFSAVMKTRALNWAWEASLFSMWSPEWMQHFHFLSFFRYHEQNSLWDVLSCYLHSRVLCHVVVLACWLSFWQVVSWGGQWLQAGSWLTVGPVVIQVRSGWRWRRGQVWLQFISGHHFLLVVLQGTRHKETQGKVSFLSTYDREKEELWHVMELLWISYHYLYTGLLESESPDSIHFHVYIFYLTD